jgi:hypothetical protein
MLPALCGGRNRRMSTRLESLGATLCVLVALMLTTASADAFCGFYVGGADAKLFNNATIVVMMRDGQRTVLSMQNNYQGPPSNFAMVVPVPVVLQKDSVKTLSNDVFERVDKLAAPRLVEYWETDPCWVQPPEKERLIYESAPAFGAGGARKGGVKIEAQFSVGEYDIVILSADDSSALATWLKDNQYAIPEGAEPLLRPYVQDGMKFFVAKVDLQKVKMKDGMAMLSPLRFHYDDDKFRLPVRLGLVNSKGTQDLIVHIIGNKRYEVANYDNVTIPTNIDLDEKAKAQFGAFYAALFDETVAKNKGAVVTEYAWSTNGCDPCPSPPMSGEDFATLGGDAASGLHVTNSTLTRLHARYGKDALGEDLVFKEAEPIVGGRETWRTDVAKLETGSRKGSVNAFQGRYAIRHAWTGPITCNNPVRGRWGGPPSGQSNEVTAALDLAFAPRGKVKLANLVTHDVDEIGLKAVVKPENVAHPGDVNGAEKQRTGTGCGSCNSGKRPSSGAWWWLALCVVALRRRR